MIHTTEKAPQESLLAPEHWGGYDIMDDATFEGISPLHESFVRLTKKERQQAEDDACENLAKIAAGNATEVRFNTGNEFSASTLNDGTIIALEKRLLLRWTGGVHDSQPANREPRWQEEYRPLYRPARSFWLDGLTKKAAGEFAIFPQQHCQYSHYLEWGVLLSRDIQRLVLPFGLSSAHLRKDGSVDIGFMRTCAQPLPLAIGSVIVSGKLHVKGETHIHAMESTDAIDVVHAAAGKAERSRSPGKLAALAARLGVGGALKPTTQS